MFSVLCSLLLFAFFFLSVLWSVVCGLWFVVCGLWFVVCGLWFVVCDLWFAVCDLWFVVCGLWLVVCGLWLGGLECRGWGLRFKVQDLGYIVWGFGFRV